MERALHVLVLTCWPFSCFKINACLLTVFRESLMKPCTVSHLSYFLCLHFRLCLILGLLALFSRCLFLSLSPSFLTQFWDKAVDRWWHDSIECTALSGSYPCCPRQSWQCCHGWKNTLFWHKVRQCQITKLCSVLSSCMSSDLVKSFRSTENLKMWVGHTSLWHL